MLSLFEKIKELIFERGLFFYLSQLYFPYIRGHTLEKKKVIAREAREIKIDKILDFGCAVGHMSQLFSPHSYIGVDINRNYINYAKRKYKNYAFQLISDNKIPVPDDSIDLILCLGTFHHINSSDIKIILKQFKKKLRNKGRVIIMDILPKHQQDYPLVKLIVSIDIGDDIRTLEQSLKIVQEEFKVLKKGIKRLGKYKFTFIVLEN